MTTLSRSELFSVIDSQNVSRKDGLLLLSNILQLNYSNLFLSMNYNLNSKQFLMFQDFLKRRAKNEPIAKIINKKYFYNLSFKTTIDSLDPRPETELMIDQFQKKFKNNQENLRILDLGCGTGCIGISILEIYKNATCLFADINQKTLEIAKENSLINKVFNRSDFIITNWFENINEKFDAILSNPPYICENFDLNQETLYDPKIALFAGKEGLDAYKKILPISHKYLKTAGKLFLEIGFDQKLKITSLSHKFKIVEAFKDLNNLDRLIIFYT